MTQFIHWGIEILQLQHDIYMKKNLQKTTFSNVSYNTRTKKKNVYMYIRIIMHCMSYYHSVPPKSWQFSSSKPFFLHADTPNMLTYFVILYS